MLLQKLFKLSVVAGALISASCTNAPTTTLEEEKTGPKNIILMVSDGIGFNGWLAADYYQGKAGKQAYQITRPDGTQPQVFGLAHSALNLVDKNGNLIGRKADIDKAIGAIEQGYNPTTRWDRFENAMLNDFSPVGKSYTSYTDSAAAGTALMSGRKTSVGRVNMDWTGAEQFQTIAQLAMDNGLSAGVVTSVMVSHATPAAAISHNVSRQNYADIFNEMVSSELSVIMGAGHPLYNGSGNAKTELKSGDYKYVGGKSTYSSLQTDSGLNGFTLIDDKSDFESVANGNKVPSKLIGLARSGSTLQASREGHANASTASGMAFNENVPDLATMSKGALNVLNQDKDGFFVMIEGGAVDWMGHANDMPRFIEEQVDFNQAVDAVIQWVEANSNWDETLLIVTSDHECGGIWGEGTWTNHEGGAVAIERSKDAIKSARFDPSEDTFNEFLAVQDKGTGNIPGFQWASGNHTNDLVPLWALGAGSEYFTQYKRTDLRAAELWGAPYSWNGKYVDNTIVFEAMKAKLLKN